jgi:YHS domain-containing protein
MMNWMNIRNAAKCFAGRSMVLAVTVAGGCASQSAPPASSSANGGAVTAGQATAPHAECLVCKYDADLACVDVTVEQDTPTYIYEGKTYYFCSKSCCKKFEKDPAKYISQK